MSFNAWMKERSMILGVLIILGPLSGVLAARISNSILGILALLILFGLAVFAAIYAIYLRDQRRPR